MAKHTHERRTTNPGGAGDQSSVAARTYRQAWWAVALYPVSFVAAFVIGEGLYTWFGGGDDDTPAWAVPAAGTPALLAFVLPGVAAVVLGRRAMRLGRRDGRTPAIVGAAIAVGFVGLNLLSYAAQKVVS